MEIIVFFLILVVYLMEYPKMFVDVGDHKIRFGYFAGHFAVAVSSAGVLFLFYKKSVLFFAEFGEYFVALILIACLSFIVSLGGAIVNLRRPKTSGLN